MLAGVKLRDTVEPRQANRLGDRCGGGLIVPVGNPIQHPFEKDLIQRARAAEMP